MKNVFISICARGGSKGVPGKNIKELNGKPLIAYSIEFANRLKSHFNIQIGLSTDSEDIIRVAKEFGLNTDYKRPDKLASDSAGKIDAISELYKYHTNKGFNADYVLDLDVSSPLRSLKDVLSAFQMMIDNPETFNLFSCNNAHKNPYFNMVEEGEDGHVSICKKLPNTIKSRQEAPKVFELNASFYIYTKAFFEAGYQTVFTPKSRAYVMDHICFDIDEDIDFEFMEFLLKKGELNSII